MKRKERHHLKENALAQTINRLRDAAEANQSRITVALIIVLIAALGVGATMMVRQRGNAQADAALAEAMVILNARVIPATTAEQQPGDLPAAATLGAVGSYSTEAAKLSAALPRLQAAADAYPDTVPGITARYHAASALSTLGRHDEAIQAYDEVISRADDSSIYARMARLGKADAQMQAGQIDASIATWTELADSADESVPKDAVLMELARAYEAKGDDEGARRAYTQIVDDYPLSPYSAEARTALGS